ncbi:hypothetical protein [Sediminimonas sp.]|uniref:hypothetical protein n=1 Tax=Sediminimonas sp. TaxID=2823379 RepID=UPI0025DF6488|nr:hypothetical protein [Sediminimonas sp.]
MEEFKRLKCFRSQDPSAPACGTSGCFAQGMPTHDHPEFYRRFGKTAKGDPRWQCRLCQKTFSAGRPARRQKRSDKNRMLFQMLCNDMSFAKICKITGMTYQDLYKRIDFFHDQVRGFLVEREDFSEVDFHRSGSRFATDSQTLMINWPTRRQRTSVAIQHLCTAHARSGYIMEASLQFDPSMSMQEAEDIAQNANEEHASIAFRNHARVWTQTEFDAYLVKLQKQKSVKITNLYQLPQRGVLVRYDILQHAHALWLRDLLSSTDAPLYFVMDDDRGLQQAFSSAFANEIRERRADLAVVSFDKGMTNDRRNQVVAAGQAFLSGLTGVSHAQLRNLSNQDYADLVDKEVAIMKVLGQRPLEMGFHYPFPRKSEPNKQVKILTDRPSRSPRSSARMLRLATLRSVDSYFHKFRSNVRFASRPAISSGSVGQTWKRQYLYKPDTMVKLAEIYRFYHNWCDPGEDKKTPAMRLGLARGRIYERDFM